MANFLPDRTSSLAHDLYTPADLSPLLDLPELASSTIKAYDASSVLSAAAAMSRVALEREDPAAYHEWADRSIQLAEDLQDRGDMEPARARSYATTLYFFGTMRGDKDAAGRVHHSLARSPIDTMKTVVTLCAAHGVTPTNWINSYVSTPDERAEAWSRYLSNKRARLSDEGRGTAPSLLYEPGVEQFVHDTVAGELSTHVVLNAAREAYLLSQDPFERRQLISRYGLSIGEYASAPEEASFHDEDLSMMAFAAMVNSDPDVPTEVKVDLSKEVLPEVPSWSDAQGVSSRASFELSIAIRDGADTSQLLQRIEAMSQPFEVAQPLYRDKFLRLASNLYVRTGQYEAAAAIIARIDNVGAWCYATDHYAQAGGNLDFIHQADEMRQIFDNYSVPSYLHDPQKWSAHERILTFFRHMSASAPDYPQARDAALRMAEDMKQDRKGSNYTFFWVHMRRLLTADNGAVELGPEIIQRMDDAPLINRRSLYELFTAHGSTEMARRGWQHVDEVWHSAIGYFDRYAHMALASSGIIPPEHPRYSV